MGIRKIVFTSYIPGTSVHNELFETLKNYCLKNDAELRVGLTAPNAKADAGIVAIDVAPYLQMFGGPINDSLFFTDLRLSTNVTDPVSGLDAIANSSGSLIIASPRHRFKSVARSLKHNNTPRGIWCTGSISVPAYPHTKSGLKANGMHKLGALVITVVNNDIFHIRQLSWGKNGMYDLTRFYSPKGEVFKSRVSGIVLGDLHPPFLDHRIFAKTAKLLFKLMPKNVFHHDIFDAASISHHINGKHITKVDILNIVPSLEAELHLTASTLMDLYKTSPESDHYVVRANHDEHLDRYLDEGRYLGDYLNKSTAYPLIGAKMRGENPLEYWIKNNYPDSHPIAFLNRDDRATVSGVECSNHGDYGANGSRGSTNHHGLAFSGKVVTAHSHSPEIGVYGNYVAGTMTKLSLPYTNDSGTSGWLNTHVIIYPDGNMTHMHLINW